MPAEERRHHLDAVREDEGEGVVGPQPEGLEAVAIRLARAASSPGGELGAVRRDERLAVRIAGSDEEEPKI